MGSNSMIELIKMMPFRNHAPKSFPSLSIKVLHVSGQNMPLNLLHHSDPVKVKLNQLENEFGDANAARSAAFLQIYGRFLEICSQIWCRGTLL
ncbi:hypothetical protein ACFX2J_014838 [Malus domestica]